MTHISAAVYIWPVNVTALIDDFLPVCVERDRSTFFVFFLFFGQRRLGSHLAFSHPTLQKYPAFVHAVAQNHKSQMRYAFDFVVKWMCVCFHSGFYSFWGRKVISGVFIQV